MLRRAILVCLIFLSGCIIIASDQPEPYQQVLLSELDNCDTRQEVEDLLGVPEITRENGSIWIYVGSRLSSTVVVLVPHSPSSIERRYEFDYLIFSFEGDSVANHEFVESDFGCSSNGICVTNVGFDPKKQLVLGDFGIVTSKRSDEHRAKEFLPRPGFCQLYVYQYKKKFGTAWYRVAVGTHKNIFMNTEVYLYLKQDPGEYAVSIASKNSQTISRDITCRAGEIVFVELYSGGWLKESYINPVDSKVGREAISKRQLVILP